MDAGQARTRFKEARVARLATVDESGRPHLVPMVFVVLGETIYSAVDAKPKSTTSLRRLANVRVHSAVAVLVDRFDDTDWTALWWVRADGTARVLDVAGADTADTIQAAQIAEGVSAIDALVRRYAQYREQRPAGPVLAIDVERWSGWAASTTPAAPPTPSDDVNG
ncbi:MAG: TIGR03668 family PPOX class F420-dependent oxidoreductase [Acidothermaceae bacterium]